jgi:peptide/nickel transport system permease protein
LLKVGAGIVALAALAAIVGPALMPFDPAAQDLALRLAAPSRMHPFGLDELGRDILARVLAGARISFLVGITVVSVSASVGTVLGAIAGYFGGLLDAVIMRLAEFQLAFPFLLLALMFMAVLGPGFFTLVTALTVALWVNFARVVRGEAMKIRPLEYIEAARSIGVPTWRIVLGHVLPNVFPSIVVLATLDVALVIIAEAALSFLGLGVQPPTPSWGGMLNDGRPYITVAWWLTTFPGAAIMLTVLGINFVGDWLRDLLDPRLQSV